MTAHADPVEVKPQSTPTSRWLSCVEDVMPPLMEAEGVAERLLLLIHYGIDWQNGWVAQKRRTYWDPILPDRVVTATFLAPSLRRWWQIVATDLESRPRNQAEREELERLLRSDPVPVLSVLRSEADALILRTRIGADAVRDSRAARGADK